MMHFEDLQNHGFWSVAPLAWIKRMILELILEHLICILVALGVTQNDL